MVATVEIKVEGVLAGADDRALLTEWP